MSRVALVSGAYQARSLIAGAQRCIDILPEDLRLATASDITPARRCGGGAMVVAVQLEGRQFGRWSVGPLVAQGKRRAYKCTCDCGTVRDVKSAYLLNGDSKSCGCLNRELIVSRPTRHGMTDTPLHNAWKWMLTRADNPNAACARNYSQRHIIVCERWRTFENFRDDMGPTFLPGLTLDRVANGQGYMPGNCRWATRREQNRNRRSVRLIQTPRGEMTITEAAEAAGTSWWAMSARVERSWSMDRLLDPPKRKSR